MIAQYDQVTETVQITVEDQTVLSARLLQTMQESMYSNRMRVAPRRIKELVQAEIALLLEFLVMGDDAIVREHGMMLAREGLGQKSIVGMASALRLGGWEIAIRLSKVMEFVSTIEGYTTALLDGYMAAYEEELRREEQRTHDAFVRCINNG